MKSFNRALHSALHGQYGKPKFRAKKACLNLQHKISSHHLVHFNDTQRSSILFTDFSFHFYATLNFFSIMVRLTDVQRGRAIALPMQGQRQQQAANHFGVNVSTIEPASVAQLDAPSDWRPGGRGFNPRRGRQHSFVEIDREIFSTVILSLPLIQEGQLSVSGERMCTVLVNRLED